MDEKQVIKQGTALRLPDGEVGIVMVRGNVVMPPLNNIENCCIVNTLPSVEDQEKGVKPEERIYKLSKTPKGSIWADEITGKKRHFVWGKLIGVHDEVLDGLLDKDKE